MINYGATILAAGCERWNRPDELAEGAKRPSAREEKFGTREKPPALFDEEFRAIACRGGS